jgi:NAD-dependent DNA ligase
MLTLGGIAMTDRDFNLLGNNILKWKHEYYVLGMPSVSDYFYDAEEERYRKEAEKRGIQKNDIGEMIDGRFYVKVGI